MPPKLQLDKAAWQWAESTLPENITEEHIVKAYRLDLNPCPQGECKRNCRGNPFCLNAIGEKSWFENIDDDIDWSDFDPESERREDGFYVGLKNLGATCYVNTFLQLWFHNLPLRNALYQWREPDMPDILSEDWVPPTICGHLQLIFALLQFSERRYIDPSSFIKFLGLDTGQQQDAQEFSKLFLSLLEDAMSKRTPTGPHNIIQEQFCGEYCYVTKCKKCGTESKTGSKFYELDLNIKGHKVLKQCLEDFLKEEKLEGENQYMCAACASKQNATRAIQLQTLPPVLNIQLLRFIFDKLTGYKKKLNTYVQFPEVLDMSLYLKQPENTVVYELSAVLIHHGLSAFSGHYVAHIRCGRHKSWYKFNDEDTDLMRGKNLHLGTEDDLLEAILTGEVLKEKSGHVAKGWHTSKNAYMLVYTRMGSAVKKETVESIAKLKDLLPDGVRKYVSADNDIFEQWVAELMYAEETKFLSGQDEQKEIRFQYLSLLDSKGFETDWLSYDWINKWLTKPEKVSSIKNKQYLCRHQRLDPDAVPKLKCVNSQGAADLVKKYSADIRLQGTNVLCSKCVRNRCHMIRMKKQMIDDEKLFNSTIKLDHDETMCYWVGRSSLRSWKRLALTKFEDTVQPDVVESGSEANGDGSLGPGEMDERNGFRFNTDLLCSHGCLSIDSNCRRLVPPLLWLRLKSYFPSCPEYAHSDQTCTTCERMTEEKEVIKGQYKEFATTQKAILGDLFAMRNRPKLQKNIPFKIITSTFIDEWRKFIKDCGKRNPLTYVTNSVLICEHGGLLYPPTGKPRDDYQSCTFLLWEYEWSVFKETISSDVEISVMMTEQDDGTTRLITTPEVCESCLKQRLETEELNKYKYDEAVIYVRKLLSDKKSRPPAPRCERMEIDGKDSGLAKEGQYMFDPDYNQQMLVKKTKLDIIALSENATKMDDLADGRRKSQRHRKMRGEKEVFVSSDMTLKDLKIKIMKQFSIPPFDQNLSMDGSDLTADTSTLQDLRIFPGAVLYLQADEPSDETYPLEDLFKDQSNPELGFQGTNLLRS